MFISCCFMLVLYLSVYVNSLYMCLYLYIYGECRFGTPLCRFGIPRVSFGHTFVPFWHSVCLFGIACLKRVFYWLSVEIIVKIRYNIEHENKFMNQMRERHNMEIWYIYNSDREKTGRTMVRGGEFEEGTYHLMDNER